MSVKVIKSLDVQRVKGGTLVMLSVWGNLIGCTMLFTLFGILASFGLHTLTFNHEYVTGWRALLAAPFMGLAFGLLWGLFNALTMYLGLRLLSMFKPLSVEFVVDENVP